MEKNMGMADAFIRFQIGVALLINIIILEPGLIGLAIMLLIALLLIKSAFARYCPLYKPLGISTIPKNVVSEPADAQAAH